MSLDFKVPVVTDVGTRARYKSVQSTDPGANTECSITVPADKYYKILSAAVAVAQGVGQTPQIALRIVDPTAAFVQLWALGSSAAQDASVTAWYNWFPGAVLTAGGALTLNNAPIPGDLIVPPGYIISTVTVGKGAATNLTALNLFIIELRP